MSITRDRGALLISAALNALADNGGSLSLQDLLSEVEQRVELSEYDRHVYEKSGYVRWQSTLHFYSIDCVKAGYLRKTKGTWHITSEGEQVRHLSGHIILERATEAYRAWKAAQASEESDVEAGQETESTSLRSFVFASAEGQAQREIEDYVWTLNGYEYQDLVAALLRGMGYSTPIIAPKGPDGGTDILAYNDPLGAKTPHIRVQVKHRKENKASREEVAALRGIIRHDREIGLFVSSSGFTKDALAEARNGNVHIELMNLDEFLALWIAYYEKLSEEDKGLLRLRTVHFLSPD